jgi:hypothetical protein
MFIFKMSTFAGNIRYNKHGKNKIQPYNTDSTTF